MRACFIKGYIRDEKTSSKMLSQSEVQKKMAAEAAAAAEKLAAKKVDWSKGVERGWGEGRSEPRPNSARPIQASISKRRRRGGR